MGGTRLVVRISYTLEQRVLDAASRNGQDKSSWSREALEAAATADEAEAQRIEVRNRVLGEVRPLGASRTSLPGVCIHPLSGREVRGMGERWCRVCGTRMA